MRTTFLDSEDKMLVVIAHNYERQGRRVVWSEVELKIRHL
ncbi:hypothetical protein Pcac1_g9404 [Phytophthora cactorum]|nr:hypothetical protein Pcac1_g9404 [Phytophthora cactorum]KAG3134691.1 hypothetical protein PC128_g26176 [Phytophthora cactorum]KAG4042450.1 hypothetical protein PC123_g22057 [Phytophthora cactorum]